MKFEASTAGVVTAIKFYKGPQNTGRAYGASVERGGKPCSRARRSPMNWPADGKRSHCRRRSRSTRIRPMSCRITPVDIIRRAETSSRAPIRQAPCRRPRAGRVEVMAFTLTAPRSHFRRTPTTPIIIGSTSCCSDARRRFLSLIRGWKSIKSNGESLSMFHRRTWSNSRRCARCGGVIMIDLTVNAFRRRRGSILRKRIDEAFTDCGRDVVILDVGGRPDYWENVDPRHVNKIILLNIGPMELSRDSRLSGFEVDARRRLRSLRFRRCFYRSRSFEFGYRACGWLVEYQTYGARGSACRAAMVGFKRRLGSVRSSRISAFRSFIGSPVPPRRACCH